MFPCSWFLAVDGFLEWFQGNLCLDKFWPAVAFNVRSLTFTPSIPTVTPNEHRTKFECQHSILSKGHQATHNYTQKIQMNDLWVGYFSSYSEIQIIKSVFLGSPSEKLSIDDLISCG